MEAECNDPGLVLVGTGRFILLNSRISSDNSSQTGVNVNLLYAGFGHMIYLSEGNESFGVSGRWLDP